MYESFVNVLREKGAGVRAYRECATVAREQIGHDDDNAAALFLISVTAQKFVDSYDDQPLTVEAAGKELERFSEIVGLLDQAYAEGSAAERIAALNAVAAKLADEPVNS
ncbi:hypothetical protein [Roseibium marinum]|uniref:Uncharacterized protein n=1 Tax=Roseibium marinum TaxID=281252 RepID=A0A2S3UY88_9HYPH|nr:hypothetical protein [Roseibium marinum]POF32692.1 hypothetical protein CLV41_10295 [Roseibium marinum]